MSELPTDWALVAFSEVAELVRGVSYKKNEADINPREGLIPILRANNIQNGNLVLHDLVYVPTDKVKEKQLIKQGDIIVAMSSGSKKLVGKSGVCDKRITASFGTFCGLIRAKSNCYPRYLGWFTQSKYYTDTISNLSKGVNINNLKPSHFEELQIPLPTLAEQKRIAHKLDCVLAKVEAAQARLDKIPAILKRFRQSVLAAATSGELTKEWRENAGIDYLYQEFKVSEVASEEKYSLAIGPFGSNLKVKDYRDDGHPLVFVREIRSKKFGGLKTKYVDSNKFSELAAHKVKPGDVLVTKMGDPPGDVAIYPIRRPEAIITSDCIKITPNENIVSSKYLAIVFESLDFKKKIKSITAGVAQQKVSLKKFKELIIALPTRCEQDEISKRFLELEEMAACAEKQYY